MATTESFNSMLKRYMPYELLMDQMKRQNWFIETVNKREDWVGGVMDVPFEVSPASSIQWGSLPAVSDIQEAEYFSGTLTNSDLKELWGSMKFNNKDLKRHGDMKSSFLKSLKTQIPRFVERMSDSVSQTYFGDGSLAVITANGTAGGVLTVDFPQRFVVGQKIYITDTVGAVNTGTYYIKAIDINTKQIVIAATRGGAAVTAVAFQIANKPKIYLPGQATDGPKSLASILLSAANGGDATYFGKAKTDAPVLQALNIDGSTFTKANLLDKLYDAYFQTQQIGKGSLDKTMVMPMSFLQHISARLENNKRYEKKDTGVKYGMNSFELLGPDGTAKFVAIRDCASTLSFILDMSTIDLCGHDFFKRDVDANGNEFWVDRQTTGKVNVVDTAFQAALVVRGPSANGMIYNIPAVLT